MTKAKQAKAARSRTLNFLQITIEPILLVLRETTEVRIKINCEGRTSEWRHILPVDHFRSMFDRLIDMGRDALKEKLEKNDH
ncbi:MAG: hypothetical protein IMY86_13745 [Chloroflexi bacterium]|nr:hypothetical protein [Chloroflexota bacterium]